MDNPSYSFKYSPRHFLYWFTSCGKNGRVTKAVHMQDMDRPIPPPRFNLAMADVVDEQLSYENITDNQDHIMLSGTLIEIVADFLKRYPGVEIFVTGNTTVKTRLYRMKIANNLETIETEYDVWGAIVEDGRFEPFRKNRPYISFLVSKK